MGSSGELLGTDFWRAFWMLNLEHPLEDYFIRILGDLDSDWTSLDLERLFEVDPDYNTALEFCLRSGVVEITCEVTSYTNDMAISATFEMFATGHFRGVWHSELRKIWEPIRSTQQSCWRFRLTPDGLEMKLVTAGSADDRRRVGAHIGHYVKKPSIRFKMIRGPSDTTPQAVAIAQANPTINVTVEHPVAPPQPTSEATPSEDQAAPPERKTRRWSPWSKVYEMLDDLGVAPAEGEGRNSFIEDYNEKWAGKPDGRQGEWPKLDRNSLRQRIGDWNKWNDRST